MPRVACGATYCSPDEIRQLEPALARRYVRALFQPDSAFVASPHRLVQCYAAQFQRLGGSIAQERVRGVQPVDGGVHLDCELGFRASTPWLLPPAPGQGNSRAKWAIVCLSTPSAATT